MVRRRAACTRVRHSATAVVCVATSSHSEASCSPSAAEAAGVAGGSPAWGPSSPSGTVRVMGTANRPGGDPRETLSFLRHGTMVREGCPTCRAKRTVPLLPPVLPSPANLAGFAPMRGFLWGFEPPLNLLHDSFPPVLELCSQECELGGHRVASCNCRPSQTCVSWVPPWKAGIHRQVIICMTVCWRPAFSPPQLSRSLAAWLRHSA